MALIKTVRGISPKFGSDCYMAENSTIVGDVEMGNQCSLWFNAVVRGDVNRIRIGNRVNVQDGAVIHCTFEKAETRIGNDVSIGHNALVHGCTIKDKVFVGMGAIVMDHAVVNSNCMIAAGAVVLQSSVLESGYIYAGIPAKKIKPLDRALEENELERIARNYILYASWYKS